MPATVVIGGQWGDEGKGRIVDLLARDASVIARYSAGNNAGHTIINHLGLFALHLVPAGIFYPDKTCLIGNGLAIDPRVLIEEIDSLASRGVSTERLFVSDRAHVITRQALARGENVLLEGAQGALLDLDGGTYDYVTSSVPSSTSAGAAIGVGIGPADITKVVGVYKAYMTRVGNGPMPTELLDETGNILRLQGPRPEVGTTTGRPRRTGWFDAVASRYSASLNSVTAVAVTRLDVLDPFPSIQVCTSYKIDGAIVETPPASLSPFERARPQFQELPGWQCDCTSARRFEELPANAQRYVRRIGQLIGKPIEIVSVGPEREQVILVDQPTWHRAL